MPETQTERKHTPGPWYIENCRNSNGIIDASEAIAVRQMDGDGFDIAAVWTDVPGDEQDANAAMIAASPDLLAACHARVNEWHADDRNFHRKEPKSLGLARAAIAKAEPTKETEQEPK